MKRFVLLVAVVLSLAMAFAANASANRLVFGYVYEGNFQVSGATVELYQDGHYVSRVTTPACGGCGQPGAFQFANAAIYHWYQVYAHYQGGCFFHSGWSGEGYMNSNVTDVRLDVTLTSIVRMC
jgi:hypothetical protein